MESTKEVLVRRSNNLFAPFTSNSNMQIDVPFSWDGTGEPLMTCTLQKDGNIRMRGTVTKGAGGGYVSITNLTGGLVFKAGKTYNFSINPDCQCTMQLFRKKDGAWENIYQFSGTWAGGAIKTFTEDTIPTRIFMNFSGSSTVKAGDEIDVLINPMLVEGDTKQDYEPYYREYESTKEVVVRRSNNLFLPFSSIHDFAIGYDHKFEYDPTLFYTIEENGNIHIHGTKSVLNSGYIVCDNFTAPLTLKAGETYSYKYNNAYGNCSLQSNVSGKRVGVLGNGNRKVTPSIDTPITHIYVDTFAINKEENIGKEYDFYLNPIVVEGDTEQDYEPYYYEAEASKLITWAVDDTLVSVMDFSNMLYNKFIDNNGNIVPNALWATTANFSPCTGNTVYWYNANMINYYPIARGCRFVFYDENKQFIGTAGVASGKEDKSVTSPENARYMKASISRFDNNNLYQPFPIKPIIYIK